MTPPIMAHWPWGNVNRLIDEMLPGVHIIAAGTGVGKTTFTMGGVHHFVKCGHGVTYLGTEMRAGTLKERFASERTGFALNDVRRRRWEELPPGAEARVQDIINSFDAAPLNRVHLVDLDTPTSKDVLRAMEDGAKANRRIFVLDHIGQLDYGHQGPTPYAIRQVVSAMKKVASDHDIIVIMAVQFNRDDRKGTSMFQRPHLQWLQGSSALEQIAEDVLAITLTLRTDLDPKQLALWMEEVNAGRRNWQELLAEGRRTVTCLKSRDLGIGDGRGTGASCQLAFKYGRLWDPGDLVREEMRRAQPWAALQDANRQRLALGV